MARLESAQVITFEAAEQERAAPASESVLVPLVVVMPAGRVSVTTADTGPPVTLMPTVQLKEPPAETVPLVLFTFVRETLGVVQPVTVTESEAWAPWPGPWVTLTEFVYWVQAFGAVEDGAEIGRAPV